MPSDNINITIGVNENGFLGFENEAVEHELLDHPTTSILDGIHFWLGGPLGFSTNHYWTTLVLEKL